MKKKDLLYYDLEAPDWLVSQVNLKYMSLVREKDAKNGIMLYKFYKREDIRKGKYLPYLVIFKDKHTWLNYYPKGRRWGKASWDYMYDTNLHGFMRILRNLRKWQDKILKKRYNRKTASEEERTSSVMKKVPELPEDFRWFCEEEVMKDANYLVYSTKQKKVYCTHCRKEYALAELESRNGRKPAHQKYNMCDKCKVTLMTISEGMSRHNKNFRRSTEIMQQYQDGVIVRVFNLFRDFEKSLTPETKIVEIQRHIFTGGKYLKYESRWDEKNGRRWQRITGNRHFIEITFAEGIIYKKNVREVLGNSRYDSYNLPAFFEKKQISMRSGYEKILEKLPKKPYVEQFIKAGLDGLAEEVFEGTFDDRRADRKQTELVKILRINREQLRWIRNSKNQYDALRFIQSANEAHKNITELEAAAYCGSKQGHKVKDFMLRKDINTKKVCEYIVRNGVEIEDFVDHVELLEKLEMPAKKQYLFPKDFRMAHQEEIEADILKNDKISAEIREQFKQTYDRWKKISKRVPMQDGEYRVVFPRDCADIKTEGRILHHCVGNYVERAAKGQTVILFIRKIENMEKRLYTMEYCGGKLMQIRGLCNGVPEEKAKKLAENFTAAFAEAEKKYIEREQKKQQSAAV